MSAKVTRARMEPLVVIMKIHILVLALLGTLEQTARQVSNVNKILVCEEIALFVIRTYRMRTLRLDLPKC